LVKKVEALENLKLKPSVDICIIITAGNEAGITKVVNSYLHGKKMVGGKDTILTVCRICDHTETEKAKLQNHSIDTDGKI